MLKVISYINKRRNFTIHYKSYYYLSTNRHIKIRVLFMPKTQTLYPITSSSLKNNNLSVNTLEYQ